MKKTRKLLALLMALAIVMTVFAFPASAAIPEDGDEAAPCGPVVYCPACTSIATSETELVARRNVTVSSCTKERSEHIHRISTYDSFVACSACDAKYYQGTTTENVCLFS